MAACTPQVVEKIVDRPVVQTVVVEKAVEVEKLATVLVEKAVEVEKRVVETVVVEKAVEVQKVETVIVEKPVEKRVVETVVVEKVVVTEKEVTSVPAPVEPVNIEYVIWDHPLITAEAELMKEYFEEEGQDTVEISYTGNIHNDLKVMLASGTPPDVYLLMPRFYASLYASAAFLPMDEVLASYGLSPTDFTEGSIASLTFMGKINGIPPWHNTGLVLVNYRKDLLDEAGIPYPSTEDEGPGFASWAELYETARQLNVRDASGTVTQWGWDNENSWAPGRILSHAAEAGGSWWDEENQAFTLTSDEVVEATQTILFDPIYEYGCSWDASGVPESTVFNRFPDGVVAMTPYGVGLNTMLSKEMTDMMEVVDAFLAPLGGGDRKLAVSAGGWGWHVPIASPVEHHAAAARFATIVPRYEDLQVEFQKIHGVVSALKSYGGNPYLDDVASENKINEIRVRAYRAEIGGARFAGWEWGDLGKVDHPWFRCTGAAGEERCAETGTYLDGTFTAEQLCEEWQEVATQARAEFRKSVGLPA